MRGVIRVLLVSLFLVFSGRWTQAHFNMLFPESASVKRGQEVSITYQWGHPFEHQLFDAPAPVSLTALAPNGKKTDLTMKLKKLNLKTRSGKTIRSYRARFTPAQFGDFLLILQTPPIWMEEEKVFFQDTVKVVLHVQTQEGWDRNGGAAFELMPLTRPYGLEPGMVFQAQVMSEKKQAAGTLVEIERYNEVPPASLPSDEQMTRSVKTDPNGVATCTLTESGWWCLTARRDGGKRKRAGQEYSVWQRTTLWVFVDEKISTSSK